MELALFLAGGSFVLAAFAATFAIAEYYRAQRVEHALLVALERAQKNQGDAATLLKPRGAGADDSGRGGCVSSSRLILWGRCRSLCQDRGRCNER